MTDYAAFLASKQRQAPPSGRTVKGDDLHPTLFDHQRFVVVDAARRGRCAVFLDTGLGKARIAASWANVMADRSLIITPLSVAAQQVREAAAVGIDARYVRHQGDVTGPGVWVTNYEMAHQFDAATFEAVILDESSILKNHTGATRNALIEQWQHTPYRLACTATPAPNDTTELANHAEFLGAMTRVEMLAAFFVHDEDGWRPKGHAIGALYEWMATWAIAARRPSDLGPFDDSRYVLPELTIHGEIVPVDVAPDGQLFVTELGGVGGRAQMRRHTADARVGRAAELLDHDRPAIAWCGLNDEADSLTRLVAGAENLYGSLPPERKVEIIEAFLDGEVRVLVTKPSIAGWGMNFQHANQQVFVGIGDSWESYYQAIRRSWRFGQSRPVDVHIVTTEVEQQIVDNVRSKEDTATAMTSRLVAAMNRTEVPA